jgi:hypothetical protein
MPSTPEPSGASRRSVDGMTIHNEDGRPDAEDVPDGSNSDGSESTDGADTTSGGGADDE